MRSIPLFYCAFVPGDLCQLLLFSPENLAELRVVSPGDKHHSDNSGVLGFFRYVFVFFGSKRPFFAVSLKPG